MPRSRKKVFRKEVNLPAAASRAQCELTGNKAASSGAKVSPVRAQCELAGRERSRKRRSRTGKGHRKKSQEKAFLKYRSNVRSNRKKDLRGRDAYSLMGGNVSLGPKISLLANRMLDGAPSVSKDLMENFYSFHPRENHWLEVSERANVSNPRGVSNCGKGVFARCDIPKDTRVCPYVGRHVNRACPASENCQYDLRMADQCYICAREVLYDVGYLQTGAQHGHEEDVRDHTFIKDKRPCPPNFGRYFNTASGMLTCNCLFEIAADGHDVMYIYSSRAIEQGEELLVDYGDLFTIVDGAESDSGTVVSNGD